MKKAARGKCENMKANEKIERKLVKTTSWEN